MIDRALLWIGLTVLFTFLLGFALPVSWLAIQPQRVAIDGDRVMVHRSFPADALGLPRPRISYVETVKGFSAGTNDGHTCKSHGGPMRYGDAKDIGDWRIGGWAQECLDDPRGYVWEACWTWHLGMIKFGAVCADHTVLRNGCEYIVSSRGLIHDRGSIYFDMVSRNDQNCFSSRAAAEQYARGLRE